jgi:quercetin 2,3-dioxygenase
MPMKRREFIKGSAILGVSLAIPSLVGASSGMYLSANSRKVRRILNTQRTKVGTLPILRAFAGNHVDYVSPFVLFDEFGPVSLEAGNAPLRVNAHPHAGFTPTSYFLSGNGHHKDSLNYDLQVEKGDFMMFNSGRGAIHMEETGQKLFDHGGKYHGFQIWLNSPAKFKYMEPQTFVHKDDKLGSIRKEDYEVKVVLGELFGVRSRIELLSPAFYFHINMKPGCRLSIPTNPTYNAFSYAIAGTVELEERKTLKSNQLALYERGESLIELYSKDGAELLLLGGQALNEPVYSYGPFVMNTKQQIEQCMRDYQAGKMGNPSLVN